MTEPRVRLVYAECFDGFRTLLFVTDQSFDVEKWAVSRRDAFRLLGVTKVMVEDR